MNGEDLRTLRLKVGPVVSENTSKLGVNLSEDAEHIDFKVGPDALVESIAIGKF